MAMGSLALAIEKAFVPYLCSSESPSVNQLLLDALHFPEEPQIQLAALDALGLICQALGQDFLPFEALFLDVLLEILEVQVTVDV